MLEGWRDVRCQGNRRAGGLCNQLLYRIGYSTVGVFETKCPRCKTIRVVRIDRPAVPLRKEN